MECSFHKEGAAQGGQSGLNPEGATARGSIPPSSATCHGKAWCSYCGSWIEHPCPESHPDVCEEHRND